MAKAEELKGPDLTQPVDIKSVPSGAMLEGYAFGEQVLLAHVGDKWFAVGGKCTHYEGNLADGILVGDTVRCPLHHACFNLANGAAGCGPALNDLAVYAIELANEKVRIVRKIPAGEESAASPSRGARRAPVAVTVEKSPKTGPSSVVIVGGGAAGNACAEMLRREGYGGLITIVDKDRDAPYDRPNVSKDYLAGNAPEEWMPLHPPDFFRVQKIDILSGAEAVFLDTKQQRVRLSDGRELGYGALLLATGASPIRLDIPGGDSVLYLRSLADCRTLIEKTKSARSAIVIGASFIGLEVAASLRARNLSVTVVAPEKLPLERVMGTELGRVIQTLHEKKGVNFRLGRSAKSIDGKKVVLDDGSSVEADLVVAGIGVKPNVALAEQAGIATDKGITVNERLETSAAGVFAAGDIARWPDLHLGAAIRVEHWVVAERQGQAVARNILGQARRFADVPFFWSRHYDIGIKYTGHAERWDSTRIDGDINAMDCAVEFLANGKILATATINRNRQNLEAELRMERSES